MGAQFPEHREEQGHEVVEESLLTGPEMNQRGDGIERGRKSSTICVRVVVLAAILTTLTFVLTPVRSILFSSSPSTGLDLGRPFFIFGDSYADVGNIPGGPASKSPYGATWPGYPDGRFSDGHIQPDYLAAQILGRQSPPPFAHSNIKTLPEGVNFAVGGSGMTYAYGSPNVSTQVSWFEAMVQSGIYNKEFLASSVTLLSVAGNDYATYRGALENYVAYTARIVGLMKQSLLKLYGLGLRNIMVTTLAPMNCLPESTILTNFSACASNATVDAVESLHNLYLQSTLEALSKDLPGINFILLRLDDALKHIQNNTSLFNITEALKPCCLGYCGGVDQAGNLLYTLCKNPENHVVWDDVHPTQAAWESIVKLYSTDKAYTTFASTLKDWARKLP